MKVFVAGGTGFIGKKVVDSLVKRKHKVTVLTRDKNSENLPDGWKGKVTFLEGNILNKPLIERATKNSDAIINLVGILKENPKKGITYDRLHSEAAFNCVNAGQKNKVKHIVQISAIGTKKNANSLYHKTKYQAEILVKNSGLKYTIFRPSTVFGSGDDSINMIIDFISKGRIVPIIGDGRYRWQPVYVNDLAEAIARCLGKKKHQDKAYECGGKEIYTYNEMVDLIASIYNKKIIKIHLPFWFMNFLSAAFEHYKWFPVSKEVLKMVKVDNVVKGKNFDKSFGLKLKSFREYLEKQTEEKT